MAKCIHFWQCTMFCLILLVFFVCFLIGFWSCWFFVCLFFVFGYVCFAVVLFCLFGVWGVFFRGVAPNIMCLAYIHRWLRRRRWWSCCVISVADRYEARVVTHWYWCYLSGMHTYMPTSHRWVYLVHGIGVCPVVSAISLNNRKSCNSKTRKWYEISKKCMTYYVHKYEHGDTAYIITWRKKQLKSWDFYCITSQWLWYSYQNQE